MKPLPVKTWELNEAEASDKLLATLKSEFTVEADPIRESSLRFLDDFDAHLWQADYLLWCDEHQRWQLMDKQGKTHTLDAPPAAKFWWQLPAGYFQDTLKNLISLRALMPVASLQMREQPIALRNHDQKLVVRGYLRSVAIDQQNHHYFSMSALRGYTKEFARATRTIASLAHSESVAFDLKHLLRQQAIATFTQEKINLPPLSDKMPTEQAVRAMGLAMLQQAGIHLDGVIADIDTEFLHQFRVNLRKLRSLVSLLHKALPDEAVALLKPALSAIAGETNKLRDLDVFLLEQDHYRAMLPASFSAGLNELYELIEHQREREKTRVARYFSSADYARDLALCSRELSAPAALQTPMSGKPLLPVIKKLLFKRYHKMLAISAAIHSKTLDEEVHELRIEFKKLRYLIEFFSSLLPPKRINKFVSDVKKIQSVLGNFNDYSIQIEFLDAYIDDSRIDMSKALSGLIAILHQHKIAERNKVDTALENFFTPEMSSEVEFLFGANTPGVTP